MIFEIRSATEADAESILGLICELAVYEKMRDQVVATPDILRETLFGVSPSAECILAIVEGEAVGFALFFQNYSTFLGRPGIYLEDLFVKPAFRSQGIGKALFQRVAQITNERKGGRMEWSVLDWNEPSIQFYKAHGAIPMDEWTVYRLTGEALEGFGNT